MDIFKRLRNPEDYGCWLIPVVLLDLALWLEKQPQEVTKVFYTGLEESSWAYLLASKQQLAFGGVLSFTVKGI
jgi:cystathionine beta-lyase/cystathionine gamma-synthase